MPNTPVIPIEFQFDGKDFDKLASQMEKLYKDAQKFSSAIKAGKEVESNNAKLKKTTTYMGEIVNLQNKHAIAANKTGGIIGGLKSKVKQLGSAIDSATNPADVRKYNAELAKTKKALTAAKNTTQGWGKALGSFQFKFNALGNIAANVVSGAFRKVNQAIQASIKTIVDFEKSFADVLTLLSEADKKKYGILLKGDSVAIMRKYGLEIKDTNKAIFDAVSAGVEAADVFNVLDAAAKLAVGGVTDLNSATKGIASVLNAFSLSSSKATDVASAFFQAQKFGITYIDEMVASMGRANTIASLVGSSYREMLATFTAITKSGLNTEEAITGLRNVFKTLVAPTEKARKRFEELGLAVGANAVKARGYIGVLDDLNNAYNNNNEIIPEIFGNIRGLTGIMGIVGKRYDEFRFVLTEVNDAMASNQALNDAVGTQMDTIAKKVDILKSAWETMFIAIEDGGGQAGSTIKDLLTAITLLVRELTPDYYEAYVESMSEASKTVTAIIDGWNEKVKTLGLTEEESRLKMIAILQDEAIIRKKTYKESEAAYLKELNNLQSKRQELADIDEQESAEAWQKATRYKEGIKLLEKEVDNKDIIAKRDRAIYEGVINGLADISKGRAEQVAEEEKLSEEELARAKKLGLERLKSQHEFNLALIALEEDKLIRLVKIEAENYDYGVKLLEFTLKDKTLYNQKKETLEMKYQNNVKLIREKGYKFNKELNESEVKDLKSKLRLEYELQSQIIIWNKDGTEELLALAKLKYDYDVEVAKLSIENEEDRLKKMATLYIEYQNKIAGIQAKKSKDDSGGKDKKFYEIIGLEDFEADSLNDMIDSLTEFTDIFVELTEKRLDAIQREINASDERVRSLQADRDHEWERMQEGYANNYQLAQQELADEKLRKAELKKEEEKALQERKKAADAQVAINTVLQLSNLLVAATEIFVANGFIPIVGVALAVAAIAVMGGAFLAFKANAAQATGYAEGVVDLAGAGTETSDSIPAKLSKGESVMTAKTTKRNKKTLSFMQKNPNHPLFSVMEKYGVNSVFNKLSDQMQDHWITLTNPDKDNWNERIYKEMKTNNEMTRNRPYSYFKNGKTYTVEGNLVTIAVQR